MGKTGTGHATRVGMYCRVEGRRVSESSYKVCIPGNSPPPATHQSALFDMPANYAYERLQAQHAEMQGTFTLPKAP